MSETALEYVDRMKIERAFRMADIESIFIGRFYPMTKSSIKHLTRSIITLS